jgi:hypothetical protein
MVSERNHPHPGGVAIREVRHARLGQYGTPADRRRVPRPCPADGHSGGSRPGPQGQDNRPAGGGDNRARPGSRSATLPLRGAAHRRVGFRRACRAEDPAARSGRSGRRAGRSGRGSGRHGRCWGWSGPGRRWWLGLTRGVCGRCRRCGSCCRMGCRVMAGAGRVAAGAGGSGRPRPACHRPGPAAPAGHPPLRDRGRGATAAGLAGVAAGGRGGRQLAGRLLARRRDPGCAGGDSSVTGDTPEQQRMRQLPSGLKLVDTGAWTVRPLDPAAPLASWRAGRLLAFGGTWTIGRNDSSGSASPCTAPGTVRRGTCSAPGRSTTSS